MRFWMIVPGVAMVVALSGCARPLKDQVVGKWQHTSGGMTVEFLKDGSLTGSAGPLPLSGSYTTPDDKHLKIEGSGVLGRMLGAQVYQAAIEKDHLTLTAGTARQEFDRAKE
jgi:hypothetical protein